MCGIFAFFRLQDKKISVKERQEIFNKFVKTQHRGPDVSVFRNINDTTLFGFHRLSIVDIENGNQPFRHKNHYLICNGEIYNHKELKKKYQLKTTSNSDCEVILHLYLKYGIEKTISLIDGVYSFVIYDENTNKIIAARDPIGVRSLYYYNRNNTIILSSELKSLPDDKCCFFPPGNTMIYNPVGGAMFFESYTLKYIKIKDTYENVKQKTKALFESAVTKRLMSDRPVGCLLSGGFDSSIVAALVAKQLPPGTLHTFSIGMEGATDLKHAKLVADHIKSIHHEVIVTEKEMLDALPDTVYRTESWDTTTIRASTPMILLCDYIKNNTDIAVLYSGEGSDEASGSYMYFYNAPDVNSFRKETIRLVRDLQYFDVLRCDKSISSAGLEARVPFLDRDFLQYYMSIPDEFKMPTKEQCEKKLLRDCFDDENLLPKEVLWRKKEAFSDGCSQETKSWYSIIQEHCKDMTFDTDFSQLKNPPVLNESKYYRELFLSNYSSNDNIIPYYWLPKWCGDVVDPSARVLDVYND